MPLLRSTKPPNLLGKPKVKSLPDYPTDHLVGMPVPKGGSDCAKCEYVDGQNCTEKHFIAWNGGKVIPWPTNEYCCDFFETA